MKQLFILIAVALSFHATGQQSSIPAAFRKGIIKDVFIYDTAPFPSCHASTIVETPKGLVAAWFGGKYEGSDDVSIYTSHLINGKWSVPALAAEVDRVTATNIRTLGESIGICFQIENDFLDKSGDPDRRGRAQRSDERNQKVNHASLDISESIIPEINRLQRQITSQLRSIEHNLAKRGVKLACSRAVLREIFSDAEIVKLEF